MGRRIAPLTVDELPDLIECCRQCVFWELTPVDEARAHRAGQCALRKEQWVSHVLLEWGSCGQVAYVDGDAVGHVLYAPPVFFPRIASFPTAPMSPDAVALGSLRVREDYRGGGLARVLIQSMAADLVRRRVRAVEAIATVGTALNGTTDSAHRDSDAAGRWFCHVARTRAHPAPSARTQQHRDVARGCSYRGTGATAITAHSGRGAASRHFTVVPNVSSI